MTGVQTCALPILSLMLNYYLYKNNATTDLALLNEIKRDFIEIEESKEKLLTGMVKESSEEKQKFNRTPNVYRLAELLGAVEEYQIFYKLYSKYTHPSAYYLLSSNTEKESDELRFVFLIQSAKYVKEIELKIKSICDIF